MAEAAAPPAGRGTSFRRLLMLLVLGVALPLLGLTGLTVWRISENEQSRFESQIYATARALALAVDRELGQASAIMRTLATSGFLAAGELEPFHSRAALALPPGLGVTLYDTEGRPILNTATRFGEDALGGVTSNALAHLRATLEGEGQRISPLFFGARTQQPQVMIAERVLVRGQPHVLGLTLQARRLREMLLAQDLPPGWSAAALDASQQILARTRAEEDWVGRIARPAVQDLLRSGPGGIIPSAPTLDGVLSITATARAQDSGFGVVLAAPTLPPWRRLLYAAGPALAAGGILAAFGLVFALLLGRRMVTAMDTLTADRGHRPTGILEVDAVAARLAQADTAREGAIATLRQSEERYRITIEAFSGGVYECFVQENRSLRSRGHLAVVGETRDTPDRDWWISRIHPADRPAWDAARARLFSGAADSFEVEYRVRHASGRWVWIWHRSIGQRDAQGHLQRMIGSVTDITAERETQAARDLLAREMDHRVKNSFALVAGLVSAAAADHPQAQDFADDLRGRLQALIVAHDLTRGSGGAPGSLMALIRRLALPYGEDVLVEGTDTELEPELATPMALVLHEWLTNAVKHGALSQEGGQVRIELGHDDAGCPTLTWTEAGGPSARPPAQRGFGSDLVASTVGSQLDGVLEEEWRPEGLRLRLRMSCRTSQFAGVENPA